MKTLIAAAIVTTTISIAHSASAIEITVVKSQGKNPSIVLVEGHTLVTTRGVEWKCHDGIIVRFDSVGEKREEGASTTLIITGLPRLGPNSLHIVESKDSKRELRERLKGRSSFLLDGKHCTIQD
jgi:hypothetical protein